MDPNETLRLLKEAIEQWNRTIDAALLDDIKEHAGNLCDWLQRGGFMPTMTAEQFAFILRYVAE